MLKKGIFALALFIAMPLYAAEYWIDVRIPEQYQREHIQGAINIPLKEIKSHIETVVPDRKRYGKVILQLRTTVGHGKTNVA